MAKDLSFSTFLDEYDTDFFDYLSKTSTACHLSLIHICSLLSKAQEEKQHEKAVSPVPAPSEPRHNYRSTEDTLGVGGAKEKFRNNMAAINLLHELELENRLATPEEQEIFSPLYAVLFSLCWPICPETIIPTLWKGKTALD